VTVATDGSVRSDDGTYSWIIDGLISEIHLAGHAKAALKLDKTRCRCKWKC
jgi:hypothetical protein